ncbi:MAG TPA: Sec-independent protein translocase protein TatB [Stellaceae bacterium]|jgi:sec-independent protein translocase protein TatB
MLFDLGWSEILLIGVVALVFIGPKDLPKAMRVAGYWIRKARTLSREFQGSIDQMIREAELDDVRQQLKKAAEFDFDHEFHNTIDPSGSLRESLKPPELPNFSGSPAPIVESGSVAAVGTAAVAPAGPEPAIGGTVSQAAPEPGPAPEPGSTALADGMPAPLAAQPNEANGYEPAAITVEKVPPRP